MKAVPEKGVFNRLTAMRPRNSPLLSHQKFGNVPIPYAKSSVPKRHTKSISGGRPAIKLLRGLISDGPYMFPKLLLGSCQ